MHFRGKTEITVSLVIHITLFRDDYKVTEVFILSAFLLDVIKQKQGRNVTCIVYCICQFAFGKQFNICVYCSINPQSLGVICKYV